MEDDLCGKGPYRETTGNRQNLLSHNCRFTAVEKNIILKLLRIWKMILTKLETLALLTKTNFTNTTKLRESPMEFNLKWNTTLNLKTVRILPKFET